MCDVRVCIVVDSFYSFLLENISKEIRNLTANDIGQNLGGHWAHIKIIRQKLGTFGRHTG